MVPGFLVSLELFLIQDRPAIVLRRRVRMQTAKTPGTLERPRARVEGSGIVSRRDALLSVD